MDGDIIFDERMIHMDEDEPEAPVAPILNAPRQRQIIGRGPWREFSKDDNDTSVKLLIVGMPGTYDEDEMKFVLTLAGYKKFYTSKSLLALGAEAKASREHLLHLQSPRTRRNRPLRYTADDFAPVFKDAEVIMGWAACAFTQDLMIAYRNARVLIHHVDYKNLQMWKRDLKQLFDDLDNSEWFHRLRDKNILGYHSIYDILITFKNILFEDIERSAIPAVSVNRIYIHEVIALQRRNISTDIIHVGTGHKAFVDLFRHLNKPIPAGKHKLRQTVKVPIPLSLYPFTAQASNLYKPDLEIIIKLAAPFWPFRMHDYSPLPVVACLPLSYAALVACRLARVVATGRAPSWSTGFFLPVSVILNSIVAWVGWYLAMLAVLETAELWPRFWLLVWGLAALTELVFELMGVGACKV